MSERRCVKCAVFHSSPGSWKDGKTKLTSRLQISTGVFFFFHGIQLERISFLKSPSTQQNKAEPRQIHRLRLISLHPFTGRGRKRWGDHGFHEWHLLQRQRKTFTFISAEVTARGVTYWGSLTRSKKPLRRIMSEYEPLKKIKLLSQWRNVSRTRPPVPWPDTLVVGHSFTSAKNALLH